MKTKSYYLIGFSTILNVVSSLSSIQDRPAICPNIISKSGWGGRKAQSIEYIVVPVKNVIIHHTVTSTCNALAACKITIKGIQDYHIDTLEYWDIGYNFIFGGDGNVYEGVGWHKIGAHTLGYNSKSIGIALIGDFSDDLPNQKMLQALKKFLSCAVELGELDQDYKLFGGKQFFVTASPGSRFYSELKNWPHYSRTP